MPVIKLPRHLHRSRRGFRGEGGYDLFDAVSVGLMATALLCIVGVVAIAMF